MSNASLFSRLADAISYSDPVAFARDKLNFTPDAWQADLLRSESKYIALNCSRQSGKSTSTAALAVWTALYDPGLILLISPSLRQTKELFGKVSGFLKELAPAPELVEDNRISCTLANGARIVALPGDSSTVRGFSAPRLIVEDEAAFVDDELHAALRPMLAVSGGRLILLSSPNGRRGHFYEAWANGGPIWQRFSVPASQCPRISAEFLEAERAAMPDNRFQAEYCCIFSEAHDSLFSYDQINAAFDDSLEPVFGVAELAAIAGGR